MIARASRQLRWGNDVNVSSSSGECEFNLKGLQYERTSKPAVMRSLMQIKSYANVELKLQRAPLAERNARLRAPASPHREVRR
jgi:hypothetical protein